MGVFVPFWENPNPNPKNIVLGWCLYSAYEPVSHHFAIKRPAGNTQFFSGLFSVPPAVIKSRKNKLLLKPRSGICQRKLCF